MLFRSQAALHSINITLLLLQIIACLSVIRVNTSLLIVLSQLVWSRSCTRTACGWQTTLARRCGIVDPPQAYYFIGKSTASGWTLSVASRMQGGNRAVLRAQIQQTFKKNAGETDPKKVSQTPPS